MRNSSATVLGSLVVLGVSITFIGLAACSAVRKDGPREDIKAILASPDRPQAERDLDASRKPDEVLKFYAVKRGEKVADLMASRGYYTVILAGVVGKEGVVYSASQTVRKELTERLQNPDYANVKVVEGKMDALNLPANTLDFVLIHLNYHDLQAEVRMGMNKSVYAALKPGGRFGIVDHAATDGSGDEVTKKLHRIDKASVIREAKEAGFVLAREGEMLRNPNDSRTESVMVDRGKSDRFVLQFEKAR